MKDHLYIGSTPTNEDCAHVGSENYANRARAECRLFALQILKHYPEPEKGYLSIKANSHDFGTYYEVVAVYDDEDEDSTNWAYDVEADALNVLSNWDEELNPATVPA